MSPCGGNLNGTFCTGLPLDLRKIAVQSPHICHNLIGRGSHRFKSSLPSHVGDNLCGSCNSVDFYAVPCGSRSLDQILLRHEYLGKPRFGGGESHIECSSHAPYLTGEGKLADKAHFLKIA